MVCIFLLAIVIMGPVIEWVSEWVSEWESDCFFNANLAIFQLYHGENKLIFNEKDDEIHFVLDQHA